MNTLRFFVLLLAVFFFAFVFQLPDRKSGFQHGVLGDRSEQRLVISITPGKETVLHSTDRLRRYRYPASDLLAGGTTTDYLSSSDAVGKIVQWYRQELQMTEMHNSIKGNQKQYLLMKKGDNQNVVVMIQKKATDIDVLIVVSITAS